MLDFFGLHYKYSVNGQKSNTEGNKSNLAIVAAIVS